MFTKVVTTKEMQPMMEVTMRDGRVTDTRSKEDIIGVDIDENILELPVGVIEPNAANCDTDVSVEPSFVTLPDGIKAKKTLVKTTVRLKDGKGGANQPVKVDGPTYLPDGSRIVEGDIEDRTETKEDKMRRRDGGIVRTKIDTTKHVKPIYRIERVKGVDRKTLLREDVMGADIVENILELPPGVQEPNGPNLRNECTVKNCDETMPDGIVAKRKIVRTIVSVIGGQPSRSSPPREGPPLVTRKNVEGDVAVKSAAVENSKNLPDGTALRKKEVTLTHFVPVTEVILANGQPPDSKAWDKVVGADVVEANLKLPAGTVEPNGANCVTDIGVRAKPITLPDGVRANSKVVDMNVELAPPSSRSPQKQHNVTEGNFRISLLVEHSLQENIKSSTSFYFYIDNYFVYFNNVMFIESISACPCTCK